MARVVAYIGEGGHKRIGFTAMLGEWMILSVFKISVYQPIITFKRRLKSSVGWFIDFILPLRCSLCDRKVLDEQSLCAGCAKELCYMADPLCQICGVPFDVPMPKDSLCGACLQALPLYTTARSAVMYQGAGRDLALSLKHAKNFMAAPVMAKLMALSWQSVLAADRLDQLEGVGGAINRQKDYGMVVIPVPLHPYRLFFRRFNQSALIASYFAQSVDQTFLPNSLRRKKNTLTQGGLGRRDRARNVSQAFVVPRAQRHRIEGRKVILIDDVYTTGATVQSCTRALLQAGAQEVHVLTFARVKSNGS